MSLHNCEHSFEQLALTVFPRMLEELKRAMEMPIQFVDVLDRPEKVPEDSGCYVVMKNGTVFYVGIAKNLKRRLKQHLLADPSGANLAVRMAAKILDEKISKVKKNSCFDAAFSQAKENLRTSTVAWIRIKNPLEMYIFEPYCAMAFNTEEFNYFDTLQILNPKTKPRGLDKDDLHSPVSRNDQVR